MSVSTAIIVNLVLDAGALAALAIVCRVPFRIKAERGLRMVEAGRPQRTSERQAA
jgi:hypothetical protein